MGIAVSNYELARTVAMAGQLGVVSGTALSTVLVRRLQQGDLDGGIRAVLADFPNQGMVEALLKGYFIEGGKPDDAPFRGHPFPNLSFQDGVASMHPGLEELCVLSSFVEVALAKRGHTNPIGINFLHKIEWPTLPSLYGAMLADVDAVLMGAGIPKTIPPILDAYARGEGASMPFSIKGGSGVLQFDPGDRFGTTPLNRPFFIGIVGNHLGVKALPNADGYVLEGPTAGGHNAPARSKTVDESGQPLYGKKDETNFDMLKSMLERNGGHQPFWLAGGFAAHLEQALELGAVGVQVGTPFALSKESGMANALRAQALDYLAQGGEIFTDPLASPSGFPFKTMAIEGSASCPAAYEGRKRRCDLGFLSEFYADEETGQVRSRCSSEPVSQYLRKGGDAEATEGKMCLCNGLAATVGLGSPNEPPLFTLGSDPQIITDLVKLYGDDYSALDVIGYILKEASLEA